jgi:HAD superfamily hydrolase (TIGR01549 family)
METVEIVSFDVFDTVLLRDGKSELERFLDCARRFSELVEAEAGDRPPPSARSALIARIYSAATAYRLSRRERGCIEGRLKDIALNTVRKLKLPERFVETWLDAEFSIESEQLRGSAFAETLMSEARSRGKRVILVSDMYLDGEDIARLLVGAGFDPSAFDGIVSSADRILNKRSGTIFPDLARDYGCSPEQFLHIGDSLLSDYQMPMQAGWKAQHLPVPNALLRARYDSHRDTLKALFGDEPVKLPMSEPRP